MGSVGIGQPPVALGGSNLVAVESDAQIRRPAEPGTSHSPWSAAADRRGNADVARRQAGEVLVIAQAEALLLDDYIGAAEADLRHGRQRRSEEHTSELQSLMRISYAVFCLQK